MQLPLFHRLRESFLAVSRSWMLLLLSMIGKLLKTIIDYTEWMKEYQFFHLYLCVYYN
mgnify:CR=1 FL=1